VKTVTWPIFSFNLFDYSARNTVKSSFRLTGSAILIRKGNLCSIVQSEKLGEPLLRFNWMDGTRQAGAPTVESSTQSERLWQVVLREPSKELVAGDVLKLGRVYMRIRALSLNGDDSVALACLKAPVAIQPYSPTAEEPQSICRICLSEGQTEDNPLIAPCDCAGSVRYLHLECLQEWLRTRLDADRSASVNTYHWRSVDCELCKASLPMVIRLAGKPRALVEINKSGSPFIVLEETCRRDRSDLHVVSVPVGVAVSIGRSPQCGIVLNDVSVSREHCLLRLGPEGFRVEDLRSKFGTLRRLEGSAPLIEGPPLFLQASRTLVSVRIRHPSRLFWLCCCCCRPHHDQVQPESSVLRHTLVSLVATNPHTEVTDPPALAEASGVIYETTGPAAALSSDEERSRLMVP
jgi:hypothetical protein